MAQDWFVQNAPKDDWFAKAAVPTPSAQEFADARNKFAVASSQRVNPSPAGATASQFAQTATDQLANIGEGAVQFGKSIPGMVSDAATILRAGTGMPEDAAAARAKIIEMAGGAKSAAGSLVPLAKDARTLIAEVLGGGSGDTISTPEQQRGYGNLAGQLGAGMVASEGLAKTPALAAAVKDALPSSARAGANFQKLYAAMGKTPASLTGVDDAALNAMELSGGRLGGRVIGTGYTAPKVLSDYIAERAQNPVMDFEKARQFQTSAGKLSVSEQMATKGPMKAQIAQLAKALAESNRADAVAAGMGDLYDAAMKEYRQSMMGKNLMDFMEVQLRQNAGKLGIGAGMGAGYGLYKALSK